MKALSRKTWFKVLKCDEGLPEEQQTRHELKHPSKGLFARIADALPGKNLYEAFLGQLGLDLLNECYVGFANLLDDEGRVVACPEKTSDKLDLLPGSARCELALEIWMKEFIEKDQRKN